MIEKMSSKGGSSFGGSKLKVLFGLFLVSLIVGTNVYAAELIAPEDESDANVVIGSNETHRNLYTVGGNVAVNSNIVGDLVVAGGMVTLDGSVEQDVMAAGGTLLLNGQIGGDARIAGGNITISSAISGDLLIGGGNITISERASIGGDLVIGGGNVTINAPVRGMLRIAGGNVTINSRIENGGTAVVDQRITFGPRAEIPGRFTYRAPEEARVQDGANVPSLEFTKLEKRGGRNVAGLLTAAFLIKLLAWIVAGLLLVKFRKRFVYGVTTSVQEKPWENLGWGLVGIIVIPILTVLLFVTFIGYYVGLIVLFSFILAIIIVNLLAALVLGYIALRYMSRTGESPVDWQAIVIGVVVLTLVRWIPFVGWIVCAILFLMTFGAILKMVKESFSTKE
jgi:hypothetical protein